MTAFRYIDNSNGELVVLVPGWATDARVFIPADIPYDALEATGSSPDDFEQALLRKLESDGRKAVLVGWSFGALLAAEFAAKHPDLVESAVLMSVKPYYSEGDIERMEQFLRRDKTGYLKMFYRRCLGGHGRRERKWFEDTLQGIFIEQADMDELLGSLRSFSGKKLPLQALKVCQNRLVFLYGENDTIAPPEDMFEIKRNLPKANYIVFEDMGHMPFLHPDFKYILEACHV